MGRGEAVCHDPPRPLRCAVKTEYLEKLTGRGAAELRAKEGD
jgi:hypothetical protein